MNLNVFIIHYCILLEKLGSVFYTFEFFQGLLIAILHNFWSTHLICNWYLSNLSLVHLVIFFYFLYKNQIKLVDLDITWILKGIFLLNYMIYDIYTNTQIIFISSQAFE